MEILQYVTRFLYRIRWYLLIIPLITVIIAWFLTREIPHQYDVDSTVYTGIISGYSLEGTVASNSRANMANLLYIITTDNTIRRVSTKLLAKCLMYGDPEHDNNYITAEHFRQLDMITPPEVKALVDKRNENRTVSNLTAYTKEDRNNFIFQIQAHHPYFGVPEIGHKLKVAQMGESDMINIAYGSDDPGIAYHTLKILDDEFINQYQAIRYGETNNVIKFFEGEVRRYDRILNAQETQLINYNVEHRIINYGEQTKQVAIMDAQFKTMDQGQLMSYATEKALLDFLESQLHDRISQLNTNQEFLASLQNISRLKSRVSNLEIQAENNDAAREAVEEARRELEDEERRVRDITQSISDASRGVNGIKRDALINTWLEQKLKTLTTEAEISTMGIMLDRINEAILYFSPIGAKLNSMERHIGFIESNYMEMLKALNAARLRQKNLQMTTATLRVLNEPIFPINSAPNNRMMVLLAAGLISFIATAAYFFLIELLDRTLRDRRRTEKLTKCPVIGCYPMDSSLRYRRYNKIIADMALRQLSKVILPKLDANSKNIINLFSTTQGDGKSYIANELEELWTSMGLQVRRLTYDEDFLTDDSRYIMATSINDLCPDLQNNEILLVEYPPLDEHEVPPTLVNEGSLSLVVARANRTWKDIDDKALRGLLTVLENKESIYFYLTEAGRDAVQEYTGQLPPYTSFNNLVYRLSQLGLTATENNPQGR
ncbi:MAG: hypothetical protein J5486_04805 [Bacteroidaceae bacterium]|nr:hypothetical protein [Bacteroidaceae bacterium]